MAAPTLAVRVGILGLILFGAVAAVALALGIIFFMGLRGMPPASLAVGVLILITLVAAIALTIVLGAGLIAAGILTVILFVVVSIVAGPVVATIAALLFLILLALVRAVIGTPLNIPFGLLLLMLLLVPIGALIAGIVGPSGALIVIAVLGYIALGLFLAWLTLNTHRIPIELLGLGGLRSMPAIPLASVPDFIEAVIGLKQKEAQRQTPIDALTNVFTLGANTPRRRRDDARTFLFGGAGRDDDAAKQYSLDDPSQFDMCWTTYEQVDTRAALLSPGFRAALRTPAAGTAMFWTNIARYWNPFGVIPITLVDSTNSARLRGMLGARWNSALLDPLLGRSGLFVIDMTIFAGMDPPTAASSSRFAPATLAFFQLDSGGPLGPTFTPILIQVSDGVNSQVYEDPATSPTMPSAWLYALQALKASTTEWGIWLGHVYRYHIVTTAMQMTMQHRLQPLHPVRQILGLQSKHTIGFDTVLLIDWTFPPPTSRGTAIEFLQLIDAFAAGRPFFDDNPERALGLQLPLQALKDTFSNPLFTAADINLPVLAAMLQATGPAPSGDPVADEIIAKFTSPVTGVPGVPDVLGTRALLDAYAGAEDPVLSADLAAVLNRVLPGPVLPPAPGVTLHSDTRAELALNLSARRSILNRMLLQDAYPASLSIMQWNRYPVAHYVVSIFRIVERYVGALMSAIYPAGPASSVDAATQAWLTASQTHGNVQGLLTTPTTSTATIADLTAVLTSLIYRITAHGISRLAAVGNPGLSWVGNFPPCLEDSRLPDPLNPAGTTPPSDLTPAQLLAFMPKTGTIGEMVSFIFSFGFTDNFQPLIPVTSANTTGLTDPDVFPFIGLPPACDAALAAFRREMTGFIRHFVADQNTLNAPAVMNFSATAAQIHQWEMNIEQ